MALLNINDMISQYAMQSGLLNSQGQMAPPPAPTPPQQGGFQGLLASPGLSQALLSMAGTIGQANEAGYGLGGGLALGAQAFGGSLQATRDKIAEAEKEATRERLAAMKDIIGLKTSQEELALRMQEASLSRRAQLDQLDKSASERKRAAEQEQAILASGDPVLIQALRMGGLDSAKALMEKTLTPKERKTVMVNGVPYYEDTQQPVIPVGNISKGGNLTEAQKRAKDMADQALSDFAILEKIYLPGGMEGKVNTGAIGPLDSLYGKGRAADQAMGRVTQNAQYMKSGASAPDAEVAKTLALYTPSALDNQDQIKAKLKSMKQYLEANLPEGYVPTYQQEAMAPAGMTTPPNQTKVINGVTYVNEGGQWYQQ